MTASPPDPDELRASIRALWERSADGWAQSNGRFTAATLAVSHWLVNAIRPQPGQHLLELAAGIGETGFLAAELIEPGGVLVSSDGAEAMVEAARARAEELGLSNVEFRPVDLEWIDARTAEFDGVLCRWGYMFAVDREAALRETRRVLRPGGRVALATWTAPERNPWAMLIREALYDAGLTDALLPPSPSPFDLATPAILGTLLEDAGFAEIETAEVELTFPYAGVIDYFSEAVAILRPLTDLVSGLNEAQLKDLRARLEQKAAPYEHADGSLSLPGVALVAVAEA
ncbi:methyltransferase domain-containing protein [Conexibacter sp. JD483]|uniref:class I SAM-dependent methyltransferase n=1 Tax=unclassified Conexibacter TaxID=2627773 RepID=UPI002716FA79|nr:MULTISPECIES: methyltransferase domain-containing protein [unclassified Conexibacter]MDO8185764.1 methyltransferase domain-containing protein [Conexibacter sp. CPCC 205706]MDO8199141.1 methyltransferase domain-containing protein [Conexibacter sp. CPCC 205762]MDR9369914.1 methyltransferase domain-containing protein [Conexibacter sp. JD483]